jgi:hypothetical protein
MLQSAGFCAILYIIRGYVPKKDIKLAQSVKGELLKRRKYL